MSTGYIKGDESLPEEQDCMRDRFQTMKYNKVIKDEFDCHPGTSLSTFLYAKVNPKKLLQASQKLKVHQEVST